ncbi:AAA family ATPase [Thiothrix lacustris]|uniref:AAA family ATPase n=1 Tax=Thiothrix lacustris TaxID=525917 RepID=UPI0027E3B811|nr:AAA family ATPase [Thiothrix lacustris]WMP17844.1 AAA family ATPase [Thiothrix lacustris]
MLKQILLKNFKSYRDQALPLAPLTLMIGANASGKSNAIEAFRFLSWLSGGQKLSVIQQHLDDSDQILRGQSKDFGYLGSQQFTLGCMLDVQAANHEAKADWSNAGVDIEYYWLNGLSEDDMKERQQLLYPTAFLGEPTFPGFPFYQLEWRNFEITLEIRSNELHIVQEQITSHVGNTETFPLYCVSKSSDGLGSDIRIAYNNFKRGKNKPQITCTDQIAVMCQLESPATFAHEHIRSKQEIPTTIKYFQVFLENTLFLDPVPALMRGDSFSEKKLRGNCSNLSGVLHYLWQQEKNRVAILQFIQSLPEQDVKDLKFFEDRRGRVALELVESFGGKDKSWSVELLSDGTLRVLAIAAAVLSAPEGSTVVLEEVDNGVHPSRAYHLLTTMQNEAKRRNIRLLLTTHNPALMDALPDEALGDVVFCYRDPQEGDSRLVRLSDLDDYAGLITQGPLGELVTNGIVDRFVKSPVTPEAKKQNALDWLARLQGDEAA